MSTGGSRWHKIDFHLHTPGVDSFAALNGINYDSPVDQQMTAEAYAAQLKSARIEIAAITDYNGIRQPWFNLIKAAAGALGITVLPGAELSLSEGKNGVHILAVFPEDTDPTEINEYLRALDRKPARQLWNRRKHEDIDLQFPLAEALVRMRERYGCLLIAAHGDSKKGIVESLG